MHLSSLKKWLHQRFSSSYKTFQCVGWMNLMPITSCLVGFIWPFRTSDLKLEINLHLCCGGISFHLRTISDQCELCVLCTMTRSWYNTMSSMYFIFSSCINISKVFHGINDIEFKFESLGIQYYDSLAIFGVRSCAAWLLSVWICDMARLLCGTFRWLSARKT